MLIVPLEGMRQELNAEVQNLMDGDISDEACAKTMNRYRQDLTAYDDEFVSSIVIKAPKHTS